MTRQEMIDELLWNTGGDGWGVCEVGNMLAAFCAPVTKIRSCVLIGTTGDPGDGFTDDELRDLVQISRSASERHVRICGDIRTTDNLTTIRRGVPDGWQWRKRNGHGGHCNTLHEVHQALVK